MDRVAAKQEAGQPQVIVDHLRPAGILLNNDHHLRPVGVPLGHDHPEEEVKVAAEQEAGRPEVIVLASRRPPQP